MAFSDCSDLPQPCPRLATQGEWEAWYASLSPEQRARRGELDPPEHAYSEADIAKAQLRAERRRTEPDPFSYADDRPAGPWPSVDQIEVPALSNTWRIDPRSGYTPGGFARRMRRVPYLALIEERPPARVHRDPEARLAWLREAIAQEETSLRTALKHVLRERHGRLSEGERGATACAMAWSHLLAGRCRLRALRELVKRSEAEGLHRECQLTLF